MALEPGMVLGEDIYSYKNDIILEEGTTLDADSISKLKRHSIMSASIKEPIDYATTHYEKIHLTSSFLHFKEIYTNNLNAYKYMIDSFLESKVPVNIEYLMQIHKNITSCAKTGEELLDMLYSMLPSEDDLTYAHCLNAALISSVFAKWLSLSEEDSQIFILCGFFYDIGKLKLPNSLIWKPDKLSEFEYNWIKTHTTLGYDLIKGQKLNTHISNTALMHHERCDGSGYPKQLKDNEIDIFAKYIAIVDVYSAMTSARIYRASKNPFQVIDSFEQDGIEKYGPAIIHTILKHIASAQLSRTVRLNNDILGSVILINEQHLSRPLIKYEETIIDLSKDASLQIVAVL